MTGARVAAGLIAAAVSLTACSVAGHYTYVTDSGDSRANIGQLADVPAGAVTAR